jgi:diguanylate cyclase (GGDEF)-like protein
MKKYLNFKSKPLLIVVGICLLIAVEIIDYQTGPEISLTPFYLLPVGIFVWYLGRGIGILLASVSVLTWFVTKLKVGSIYSTPFNTYWNIAVRLVFFIIIIFLLSKLKLALQREKDLSRIDYTTGVSNRRYFFELLDMELNKARRYNHPISIAYLDVDNFKGMNDLYGHNFGDNILCSVAASVKDRIRSVDVVSRLGGDEFGILLPETGHEAAKQLIEEIQQGFDMVAKKNEWPVTLSIGVVSCLNSNITSNELVKKADDLMYSAKKKGKHMIEHIVLGS